MSIPARNWAWECIGSTSLNDGQKVVLLWLAERADETGYCWPTIPQIAKGTGVSERNAIRIVSQLEQRTLLAVKHSRGRGRANEYRLTCQPVTFSGPENMTNPAENLTGSHDNGDLKHDKPGIKHDTGDLKHDTGSSATVIDQPSVDQPSENNAVRGKRGQPTWGRYPDQEAFALSEVARYAGLWTDLDVRERIDLALCHKSAKNYTRWDLYVAGWLRRDAEAQRRTNGQHPNPAHRTTSHPASATELAGWSRKTGQAPG